MLSVRGSLLSLDKIRIHTEQPAAHRLSPPADFDSLTHSSDLGIAGSSLSLNLNLDQDTGRRAVMNFDTSK